MQHINLDNTIIDYQAFDNPFLTTAILLIDEKPNVEQKIICTTKTPFHPINYHWPDQPGDKGIFIYKEQAYPITDSIIVAYDHSTNKIYLNNEIPVKNPQNDWVFMVGHVVSDKAGILNADLIGEEIILVLDKDYRTALSAAHSACHLASLALNKMTAKYWKKTIKIDSLSNPDFDSLTINQSKIGEYTSRDIYRLSKSVRKKGLNTESLFQDMTKIEEKINGQLCEWLKHEIEIKTSPRGESLLSDRREWECQLVDGIAKIPCGGTHILNFHSIQSIKVKLSLLDDVSLCMHTSVMVIK